MSLSAWILIGTMGVMLLIVAVQKKLTFLKKEDK